MPIISRCGSTEMRVLDLNKVDNEEISSSGWLRNTMESMVGNRQSQAFMDKCIIYRNIILLLGIKYKQRGWSIHGWQERLNVALNLRKELKVAWNSMKPHGKINVSEWARRWQGQYNMEKNY